MKCQNSTKGSLQITVLYHQPLCLLTAFVYKKGLIREQLTYSNVERKGLTCAIMYHFFLFDDCT